MILLAGALDGEIRPYTDFLEDKKDISWREYPLYSGLFQGIELLVARTGNGKVQTTAVLQHIFDSYPVSRLIYSGIAGALNPEYRTGDIVVSRDSLQYDVDASRFGYEPGEVPGTGIRILRADSEMAEAAGSFKVRGYKVHFGRILTGDRFIKTPGERDGLRQKFSGDAVEMEGAAAAMAAQINRIPWILIRVVSDQADGRIPGRFNNFLSKAAERNANLVKYILPVLQSHDKGSIGTD